MSKISILSFNTTKNYGGLLQIFALQYFLKTNHFDVEHLNYVEPKMKFLSKRRKLVSNFYHLFDFFIKDRKRVKNEKTFREKINITSTKFNNSDDLQNYKTDYFIVGSDQVWNPYITNFDESYLLNFKTNSKKIAYAASIGLSDKCPVEWTNKINDSIKEFLYVSLREPSATSLIESKTSINCDVDPTLFLTKEEWLRLTKDYDKSLMPKNDYVLCYIMPGEKTVTDAILLNAKYVAKKYNKSLVVIGLRDIDRFKFKSCNLFGCGPSEFINLINKASFVLTNSFHGTVFSNIFNKKFISFIKQDGLLKERLTNFISAYNSNDNLFVVGIDNIETKITNVMNSKSNNNKINKDIKISKQHLLESLK